MYCKLQLIDLQYIQDHRPNSLYLMSNFVVVWEQDWIDLHYITID